MHNPSPQEKTAFIQNLFNQIATRYDLMNQLITGGLDMFWREQAIRRAGLHPNASLLDLGTGTGQLAREALRQQPKANVTAADLTIKMMQTGRQTSDSFLWVNLNALELPFANNQFNAVVSSYLMRNVTNTLAALKEQYRVLKPRGRIVILETTRPRQNVWFPLIWGYLNFILPAVGGLITRQRHAYSYLAESTFNYFTAEQLAAHLAAVGFKRIGYERLMLGTIAIHWGEK